jgi:Acyl-CoA synthetases (AMP-forming)/AMP-acid ligases II
MDGEVCISPSIFDCFMNAAELLSHRANLTPNREALYDVTTGLRYTYVQLNQGASRVANFLVDSCDLQKGDRVSVFGPQ